MLANEAIGSAGVASRGEDDEPDGAVAPSPRHKRLVEFLLRLLKELCVLGAAASATPAERGSLRLAAAFALLKMARVPLLQVHCGMLLAAHASPSRAIMSVRIPLHQVDAQLGAGGWHRLVLCMQARPGHFFAMFFLI